MLSNMSVPGLISEKIRLKSRIQSRNYLLGEFRQIVKRENERDSCRIAEIEEILKTKANNKNNFRTFILF
ncbi:MAG: hypothetical protein V1867_00920 [Candidatus Falkowbacteria bacterium]